MLGAILPGAAQVELREFAVPEPSAGQALVRMQASGLCGSDLRAISGVSTEIGKTPAKKTYRVYPFRMR